MVALPVVRQQDQEEELVNPLDGLAASILLFTRNIVAKTEGASKGDKKVPTKNDLLGKITRVDRALAGGYLGQLSLPEGGRVAAAMRKTVGDLQPLINALGRKSAMQLPLQAAARDGDKNLLRTLIAELGLLNPAYGALQGALDKEDMNSLHRLAGEVKHKHPAHKRFEAIADALSHIANRVDYHRGAAIFEPEILGLLLDIQDNLREINTLVP